MAEELTDQGGVGEQGQPQEAGRSGGQAGQPDKPQAPAEGATGGEGAAVAPGQQPPTAAGAPATAEPQINLDDLPQFRKFKSERDRREAQMQRELAELRQRQAEAEQRAAEAQVAGMDPEEQAAFYRQQAERERQRAMQQQQRATEQQQIVAHVQEQLQGLGIAADDPALDWPADVTWQNAAALTAQAGRIAAERARKEAEKRKEAAGQVAQQARQQAIQETGAARVSTATGRAPEGLRAEYEQKRQALEGSGDLRSAMALKREYRKKGLDV